MKKKDKPNFRIENTFIEREKGIIATVLAVAEVVPGARQITACNCDSEYSCSCDPICRCDTQCKDCYCVSDCRCDSFCRCEQHCGYFSCQCEHDKGDGCWTD